MPVLTNKIREIPKRHPDCKFYDKCLNKAAHTKWGKLSCEDCSKYIKEELSIENRTNSEVEYVAGIDDSSCDSMEMFY